MGLVPGHGRRLGGAGDRGRGSDCAGFDRSASRWLSLIAVAVMLVIIFLEGTSPGAPDESDEFQAMRDSNRDS